MKHKKIKKIGIALFVVMVLLIGLNYQEEPSLILTKTELTVECGDSLPDLSTYIDMNDADKKEVDIQYSPELDSQASKVGEYEVCFHYKNQEKKLLITVVDSTAPEITLIKNPVILENESLNLEDFVSVKDCSNYEIDFDDSEVIYHTAGTYTGVVTVKDVYDNTSTMEIPVQIDALELSLSSTSLSLDKNGTGKLEVSTNSNKAVTFKSSNEQVAQVDTSGNVIAVGAGTATIYAEIQDQRVACQVTVKEPKRIENSTPNVSYTVYKTKTGDCYHRDNCRYLRKSKIAISLTEAKQEGLRPCSICNP